MKKLVTLLLASSLMANAAETPTSIDDDLQTLKLESNQLPSGVEQDKLYALTPRYSPLRNRFEFTLGGAKNFNPDSHTTSSQLDVALRYHISDRWSVAMGGAYVFNSLSDAGRLNLTEEGKVPDVGYPKYRFDLLAGFNTFYGKLRFSMDSVVYFDQYLALGPALVKLQTGDSYGVTGDIGFAFWFGPHFSARLGVRDCFFEEKRLVSSNWVHHVMGHADVGYVF